MVRSALFQAFECLTEGKLARQVEGGEIVPSDLSDHQWLKIQDFAG